MKHLIQIRGWGLEDPPDQRYGHIIINSIKTPVQDRGLHIVSVSLTESGRIDDVVHNVYDVFKESDTAKELQVGSHRISHFICQIREIICW